MNLALDNLYGELLCHVDDSDHEENLTNGEKAKRFLEEKNVAIEKLNEISLKQLEEESNRKEEAKIRELELKRQDAITKRKDEERHQRETIRRIEERTVRFWLRGANGKRKETGVSYFGESKRAGDAWVPHGHGEYRVNAEVIYEGAFSDGAMHGDGRLLLDSGEIWVGQMRKDVLHGIGTLISEDDTQPRRAIYWRGRRVCFLDELKLGCRIQMLGDEFVRTANGEGMVLSSHGAGARYAIRLDSGVRKLLRLDYEHFRVLRHKPPVITLDPIVGSTACGALYDYDDDQENPKTTVYRENFFWPDMRAGRERAKEEQQAERDLEAKRSKILARRQAVQDAAEVASGLEQERERKERNTREEAEAAERRRDAADKARVTVEAKKQRLRDISRSPPLE